MTAKFESISTFNRGGRIFRRWTKEEKRRIVEETLVPGASVSVVARQHDINANQVFGWRQQYRHGKFGGVGNTVVPVGIIGDGGVIHPVDKAQPEPRPKPKRNSAVELSPSLALTYQTPAPLAKTPLPQTPPAPSRIEIELASGIRVRIDGGIAESALERVVKLVRGIS